MASFKAFLKSGHPPTLFAAFLYFDFCFAIWVLDGALGPFLSKEFGLTPMERGFLVSVPILAGALMRVPLGIAAQYIGRKWAACIEMGTIIVSLCYGAFFVNSYNELLIMGVMLGLAGASFGVALSLGGGWFPPENKGLAIGIAGAGNSGAIIAMLAGPPIAIAYGWRMAYFAGAGLMIPALLVMLFAAKEPPDRTKEKFTHHLKIFTEKDSWVFSISYILTFGGYIGMTNFLPTFLHFEYDIPLATMGKYAALIAIMASISRIAGGWLADRFGGIRNMLVVCVATAVSSFYIATLPPFYLVIPALIVLFLALGAGNGSTFQLVPLRWVGSTAIVMSLVGEIGALGGGFIPNIMGYSKQRLGSYQYGFIVWAVLAIAIFIMYMVVKRKWETSWVGKGGMARHREEHSYESK
ncbi:MAG: NarK/NasA family nitrate transporter [Deltaproteobacteria bacterium]|nr:NarK/NasA family nitrate transporter [Deltaproteobacteria bacterium]